MRLLDVDSRLRSAVPDTSLEEARELAVVRVVRLRRGAWAPQSLTAESGSHVLGLFVVSGLLLRSVSLGCKRGAELIGPGDFVRPSMGDRHAASSRIVASWSVLEPAVVACLDRSFALRTARWPEIAASLFERADEHARLAAFQLALTQIRRVTDRILLLLWRLADRWGRITAEGVELPLRLSHESIGRLIGAKRPTVTSGLAALCEAGLVTQRARNLYLLRGDPPRPWAQKLPGADGTAPVAAGVPPPPAVAPAERPERAAVPA